MQRNRKGNVLKNHRNSTDVVFLEHSLSIHSISMAGYVTTVLAFICGELSAREATTFCDFWKITSRNFTDFCFPF